MLVKQNVNSDVDRKDSPIALLCANVFCCVVLCCVVLCCVFLILLSFLHI